MVTKLFPLLVFRMVAQFYEGVCVKNITNGSESHSNKEAGPVRQTSDSSHYAFTENTKSLTLKAPTRAFPVGLECASRHCRSGWDDFL